MATPDRPVRHRRSRSAEVQEAVKDLILARRLASGDPLPTESDLMRELGISRNSVREALKALQAVGIVEIRHGSGMFVGQLSLGGLVDELAFHGRISSPGGHDHLGYLIEVREILEVGLVEQLIDRRAADLPVIAGVLARMEDEARAGDVSPETDRLFHDLLYLPLGNPLVGQLLGAFWEVYHQLCEVLPAPVEAPVEVAARHRAISAGIAAGDKAAAAAAMRGHFDGVRARLAGRRRERAPAAP